MTRRVLVFVMCAFALPAWAQKKDKNLAQAKAFFDAGKQAYDKARYDDAALAFEQAYELTPLPAISFTLAQSYRLAYAADKNPQKLKRAVDLYRGYLSEVKQGGRRKDAEEHLKVLGPALAKVEAEQAKLGMGPIQAMGPPEEKQTQLMISSRTPGARAGIGDDPLLEVPLIKDVPPGKYTVHVEAPGHFAATVEAIAVEGQVVPIEVPLKEQPARLVIKGAGSASVAVDGQPYGSRSRIGLRAGKHFVSVTRRGHYAFTRDIELREGQELELEAKLESTTQRNVSYYMLIGSVALLAGGGLTTGLAFVAQSDAEAILDKRDGQMMNLTANELSDYNDARDRRNTFTTASYILYGSAAAVGVTGLLLYLIDSPRVEGRSLVTPTISDDGFGASLSGRF